MSRFLGNCSVVFSAGAVGGLANSVVLWVFGFLDITPGFGVHIAPAWTPGWLYPRIVWGGIWGFLFLLPMLKDSYFWRGILYSIAPTLVQLLVVFPLQAHQGLFGLGLGALTPAFVVLFNAVWGVTAAYVVQRVDSGGTYTQHAAA